MEDVETKAEIMRLTAPHKRNQLTLSRWELVFSMWASGKTLLEIGKWIGRSESTARALLKRAVMERQKKPGFVWPRLNGKFVCDVPHPMPQAEYPYQWHHARARRANSVNNTMYCPVCKRITVEDLAGDVHA